MPCYHPVKAFYGNKLASGKREIVFSSSQAQSCLSLGLPCNNCIGCFLERSRQWAMRCVDEASLFDENSFITLSLSPESMKAHGRSVDIRYLQKFLKRFRKEISPRRIRFFACAEYGGENGRPHYHMLVFNYGFPDKVYFRVSPAGEKLYRSSQLERLWPFGFSSIGEVTFGSAAYVARYHLKKVGSVVSRDHYLDKSTGEMLKPEFVVMSRGSGRNDPDPRFRGGIGSGWFKKYQSDVFPRDSRVIKGVDTKPCKFYDSQYEVVDPDGFRLVKLRRSRRVDRVDNSLERLAVKEKVKCAQVSILSTSKEI